MGQTCQALIENLTIALMWAWTSYWTSNGNASDLRRYDAQATWLCWSVFYHPIQVRINLLIHDLQIHFEDVIDHQDSSLVIPVMGNGATCPFDNQHMKLHVTVLFSQLFLNNYCWLSHGNASFYLWNPDLSFMVHSSHQYSSSCLCFYNGHWYLMDEGW